MLNVTSLCGRSDVDEKKDELTADRVGLYAMVKAGYAPRAFAENLDRISSNKGHTGNFVTDIFDITSVISLRVRVAREPAGELPGDCKQLQPKSSGEFTAFQEAIRNAPLEGIQPRCRFNEPMKRMRPALMQVRFSPNGAYVLAQDETSIHIMSRSPLKRIFSISIELPTVERSHTGMLQAQ
ncbi:MAG: hypothetical protein WBQ95_18735 [Terracidiphilus sp.]